MYRLSYCRFCSADASDLRVLEFKNYIVECTNCGKLLWQIPADSRSPYYYLKEVPLNERQGRRYRE